jgi:hypothetical protein
LFFLGEEVLLCCVQEVDEEVTETQEIVAFKGVEDLHEAAISEDELEELLVGPVVCSLYGLSEVLPVDVVVDVLLYVFGEGTMCLSVAGLQDVQVLPCDEDLLLIALEEGGNLFCSQGEAFLPRVPFSLCALLYFYHEFAIAIVDESFVYPFREHADV